MTEHAPEFYTEMHSRLDTIHNDLIEIKPKKDINVISKPLPMHDASVLIGFPGSGLVGTIGPQNAEDLSAPDLEAAAVQHHTRLVGVAAELLPLARALILDQLLFEA